jgi:hypothetical protein
MDAEGPSIEPGGESDASEWLGLSEREKRVLELYDQVRELELEVALLKARESYSTSMSNQFSAHRMCAVLIPRQVD